MQLSQQISDLKKILTAVALAATCSLGLSAEGTIRLPGQHLQQHGDLLANQGDAAIQLENATKYLESLFAEEEEPELDIYTEGWDSGAVNCYDGAQVPQTAVINVANFAMPHSGYITSPYGYRRRWRRMHKGVDLKLNVGDTVRAAFDGKVRIVRNQGRRKGYGMYIVIRHPNQLETVYGHLSKWLVEPDQYVKAGDPIALGGNTGRSTGPHLHFETRYMGYAINPCAIFDFPNQTTHTDEYTFDKKTYQQARNFSPQANAEYAEQYRKEHPIKIYVPEKGSGSSGNSIYRVRKGDSLGKIASRNGTTVAKICRLNGIKASSTLRIGQKLKLR